MAGNIEELKRVQNGLETRMREEMAKIARRRRVLDRREKNAIKIILDEGKQNRLPLVKAGTVKASSRSSARAPEFEEQSRPFPCTMERRFCLHKLHATLCEYKRYEARYADVVELIRYTYERTPCRKRIDGLKELVTQYVAQEQIQIACSEPCLELVEAGKSPA